MKIEKYTGQSYNTLGNYERNRNEVHTIEFSWWMEGFQEGTFDEVRGNLSFYSKYLISGEHRFFEIRGDYEGNEI